MVWLLQMKLPYHHDYDEQHTELCERVLLSVWRWLDDYHDELVLIGGMVPRYLSEQNRGVVAAIDDTYLPPRTMDVDVGIALGAGGKLGEPISARLRHHDFVNVDRTGRFTKSIKGLGVHVDFLAEKEDPDGGDATMVDDVVAQAVLGIERALAGAITVRVTGLDLDDQKTTQEIRIADAGPFICLKLQAYADPHRHAGKDVFDVVRTVVDYKPGFTEALQSFRSEQGRNPARVGAIRCLQDHFGAQECLRVLHHAADTRQLAVKIFDVGQRTT